MSDNSKSIFTNIYDTWSWDPARISRSGPGSHTVESQPILDRLPTLIADYDIKTILDPSCGDFNWMKYADLSSVTYLGGDIVDQVVAENTKLYEAPNVRFAVMDLLVDDLPQSDLIICKDTLFHFTNADIRKAIENIKRSGSKYLLTTTYTRREIPNGINADIRTGEWRILNLQLPPFNFPEPLEQIFVVPWDTRLSDRTLSLWNIADL